MRRSDTVASTVFGRHLAATNSTYLASTSSRPDRPNATSNDDDIPISDQQQSRPSTRDPASVARLPEYLQFGVGVAQRVPIKIS